MCCKSVVYSLDGILMGIAEIGGFYVHWKGTPAIERVRAVTCAEFVIVWLGNMDKPDLYRE